MEEGGHPTQWPTWGVGKQTAMSSPWIQRERNLSHGTAWGSQDKGSKGEEFQRWSTTVPWTETVGLQATSWQKRGKCVETRWKSEE